jgi:hypothetical protein
VSDPTEDRLDALVYPVRLWNDPSYKAQVTLFRRWLAMTEDAMRAEDVDSVTAQRVSDAHERIADRRREVEAMARQSFAFDPAQLLRRYGKGT